MKELGEYIITYSAVDWANRNQYIQEKLLVFDNQPPKVSVGEMPTSAKVGQVNLPQVTVTDNDTQTPIYYVTVFSPSGKLLSVTNNSFVATEKGLHRIVIVAYDAIGNRTCLNYTLKVD